MKWGRIFKTLFMILIYLLIFLIFAVGGPLLIKIPYKQVEQNTVLFWGISAGEWLNYYGILLSGVVAFFVLYITLRAERNEQDKARKNEKRVIVDVFIISGASRQIASNNFITATTRVFSTESRNNRGDSALCGFLRLINPSSYNVLNAKIEIEYNGIQKHQTSSIQINTIYSHEDIYILLPEECTSFDSGTYIKSIFDRQIDATPQAHVSKVTLFYVTEANEHIQVIYDLYRNSTRINLCDDKQTTLYTGQLAHSWYYPGAKNEGSETNE